jgi:hypothetical protein
MISGMPSILGLAQANTMKFSLQVMEAIMGF